MFLWLLGVLTLSIIVLLVISFVLKVVLSKRNLSYYEKQGAQIYFDPLLGQVSLFSPKHKENQGKPTNCEHVKKLINNWKGAKVLAANNFVGTSSTLFLYDNDLIKEFLVKEDLFQKEPFTRVIINELGLFYQNGETFNRSKALFMKIFAYDGMDRFAPRICKIIKDSFAEFNEKHQITKDEFKRINLDQLYGPVLERIATLIIFGQDSCQEGSDEWKLCKLNDEFIENGQKLRRHLLFAFFPQISAKLGLVGPINDYKVIQKHEEELLDKIIRKKKASPEAYDDCVIDRIIAHNLECERTGNKADIMTLTEIMGNYNLFHVAATDTAQNSTKMSICHQTIYPANRKLVEEITKEIYDADGLTTTEVIDKNEKSAYWLKETLRLHSPAARIAMRFAVKDVSLGKFTVKKGDAVAVLLAALNFDESAFSEADSFKTDRFSKENEKTLPRYQYLPFSVGKRACLGRHLGELILKLLVTQFSRTYDFTKPEDIQYKQVTGLTNMMENPFVMVKLK